MDLTGKEDIKIEVARIYRKPTQKKDLPDPDNHDRVITYLEPDILECELKWTLGGITLAPKQS